MKEATGELSMTVVVIVAVIAILGVLTVFVLPSMGNYLSNAFGEMKDTSNCKTNPTTGQITCN